MWAACCNWLCVDTGPEEISHSGTASDRSNQNVRTSPPLFTEVTCRACGARLQTTARKTPCMDCRNTFCGSCLQQLNDGLPLCQVCRRIRSTSFTRDELLKLKVKDLRDYLSMRDIPTDLCREKEELVQLVLALGPMSYPDVTIVPPFPYNPSSHRAGNGPSQTEPAQDIPTVNQNIFSNTDTRVQDLEDYQQEDETESIDSEEILVPGRRASLSDIGNPDDVESLSVRQLKEILARNFVNYKGCCEKWELMERVTRLYHEQKDLLQRGKPSTAIDEHLCKVCMDSPIDCVLLECGHMVTCTKCGKRMSECPICRQYVVRAVHVFRS
ncbi:PREDICTED: E3 ubiquitin-protein ligase rififylin [Nanorana parkeri]|uniref:E3 ubiquitin-protein ligase rififylin n=1 Tax=Nanorana parkeri TaxID=125878 RepID=UPI0008542652|nr:PREDICTED: E3 ubiquitin-protein ligase rififylin [Nanorana parkeri]